MRNYLKTTGQRTEELHTDAKTNELGHRTVGNCGGKHNFDIVFAVGRGGVRRGREGKGRKGKERKGRRRERRKRKEKEKKKERKKTCHHIQ